MLLLLFVKKKKNTYARSLPPLQFLCNEHVFSRYGYNYGLEDYYLYLYSFFLNSTHGAAASRDKNNARMHSSIGNRKDSVIT